jgi:hypothetical protein
MKDKSLDTYPIAFLDVPEKRFDFEPESLFDKVSRDSYFKSLEKAQKNLSLMAVVEFKKMFFQH